MAGSGELNSAGQMVHATGDFLAPRPNLYEREHEQPEPEECDMGPFDGIQDQVNDRLKGWRAVRIRKHVRRRTLPVVIGSLGVIDSALEFTMGWTYNRVMGKDWFTYYGPGSMKYTSAFSIPAYGLLHMVAVNMSYEYLREKGYETVGDVPAIEWVKIGACFGLGAATCEWITGAIAHKVLGTKFYDYDSPLVYTSFLSIPIWGIAGVLGTMFGMWLIDQLDGVEGEKEGIVEEIEKKMPKFEPVAKLSAAKIAAQNRQKGLDRGRMAVEALTGDGLESLQFMPAGRIQRILAADTICSRCGRLVTVPDIYDSMDKKNATCAVCKAQDKIAWKKTMRKLW